jgi:hypothetical protein
MRALCGLSGAFVEGTRKEHTPLQCDPRNSMLWLNRSTTFLVCATRLSWACVRLSTVLAYAVPSLSLLLPTCCFVARVSILHSLRVLQCHSALHSIVPLVHLWSCAHVRGFVSFQLLARRQQYISVFCFSVSFLLSISFFALADRIFVRVNTSIYDRSPFLLLRV